MTVPILDLSIQHDALQPQINDKVTEVIASGKFILGPYVEEFEQKLAEFHNAKHAIGVSSGSDALLVSLMALGIKAGDEVITTPFTFFATAGAIARLGAVPVFIDIDPKTFNLEHQKIEPAITHRTKAIMPVHLFGLPTNMDPIMQLAEKHDLKVVEDAAQSIGAMYTDKMACTLGHCGCLSFYPSKNLSCMGDAGAIITNDDELAEKLRQLRNHGMNAQYKYASLGGNFRIDAIQAAILSIKLDHLNEWTEKRIAHAQRYNRHLEDLAVATPHEYGYRKHVFNQYTIRVHGGARDGLMHHLSGSGIGCRVYYPSPLHVESCFEYLKCLPGSLPMAEEAATEVLSLPVFPEMTREQQDVVIDCIKDFFTSE
ncbi:DegT/DnrJ/EryC1/StrS family aminotransferase [Poriferisphaera sp. WC338]|uniref:DegT/DnrJ/EryC1/StrS family aminotransferase n=1 Tax=Poriferisphaera sp. WC338 TaxID=3425129 RepID=UPI003D81A1D3